MGILTRKVIVSFKSRHFQLNIIFCCLGVSFRVKGRPVFSSVTAGDTLPKILSTFVLVGPDQLLADFFKINFMNFTNASHVHSKLF